MNPTLLQLAREALAVLDRRAQYERTHNQEQLRDCKAAEKRLRSLCREILGPPPVVGPTLFDPDKEG